MVSGGAVDGAVFLAPWQFAGQATGCWLPHHPVPLVVFMVGTFHCFDNVLRPDSRRWCGHLWIPYTLFSLVMGLMVRPVRNPLICL
jgi:hypothetical protein